MTRDERKAYEKIQALLIEAMDTLAPFRKDVPGSESWKMEMLNKYLLEKESYVLSRLDGYSGKGAFEYGRAIPRIKESERV